MRKYPKIQTLWKRNEEDKFKIIEGEYSCPEFDLIKKWHITEKIDGTNIRIMFDLEIDKWIFGGRTDDAQIPTFLLKYLQEKFTDEKLNEIFFKDKNEDCSIPSIILFGEGYGQKIQKVGEKYRKDNSFILFDVFIGGYWLERDNVKDIAKKLDIDSVPELGIMNIEEAVAFIKSKQKSKISEQELEIEGIVARTVPQMLFRNGEQIIWKLKVRDYKRLKERRL